MSDWYMVTVVGKDQQGIVATLSQTLFENNANLGEASMIRLGGNFTIMLMVSFAGTGEALASILEPVESNLDLTIHIDQIEGRLHDHMQADVQISIYGADRSGIVAKATRALTDNGLYILELRTDVAGTENEPLFVMEIEGSATQGYDAIEAAAKTLTDLEVRVQPIDTLIA